MNDHQERILFAGRVCVWGRGGGGTPKHRPKVLLFDLCPRKSGLFL